MPVNYRRHIPEVVIPDKRLGRSVNHDPRSLAYKVTPDGTVASARWERVTPVLDQGDLGSCTGNAACGTLGTELFYSTLMDTLAAKGITLDENEAIALYSAATKLDEFNGTYPPNDTGSSGLCDAKACKAAGLISGYTHITSLAAAQTAIQSGPFIVGTDWLSGMDEPDANGVVKVSGSVRGGHEYEVIGYTAPDDTSAPAWKRDHWEFVNSWGTSYGVGGHFFYSSADFAKLLSREGDATVFVPLTQAPPVPTVDADQALIAVQAPWAAKRHTGENKAAAQAFLAWRKAKGL